jgi:CheY-like chemotaxis protein
MEAFSAGAAKGSELVVRLPAARQIEGQMKGNLELERQNCKMQPLRILVADDHADSADCLARLLQIDGHELRVAYDGPAALAVAASFQPRVILLDIGIPGLTGYEVARCLRERPETKNATLVAITGWAQAEDQRRSKEAGFDYHLLKPLDPESLRRLLKSIRS